MTDSSNNNENHNENQDFNTYKTKDGIIDCSDSFEQFNNCIRNYHDMNICRSYFESYNNCILPKFNKNH